ncbi:hypothetical protein [Micromonospora sp. NPDC005173]|uniref:hypothetical protein n=1 Tax=Micromonospora sp. NPDC005173 TaxID=3157165 RepID=UPI0033A97109
MTGTTAAGTTRAIAGLVSTAITGARATAGAFRVGPRPTGPLGLLPRHSVPPLFGCSDRDVRWAGRHGRIH